MDRNHPPPKQFINIEQLLDWAFRREAVHCARRPGLEWGFGFGGSDSTAAIGVYVSASRNLGFEAPADAYTVAAAVGRLPVPDAQLVRHYALAVGRPDWTPHPVIRAEQTGVFEVSDPELRTPRGRPYRLRGCTFRYTGDLPEYVRERRAVYLRWALAVAQVDRTLRREGQLVCFMLTGEPPPPRPWEGQPSGA